MSKGLMSKDALDHAWNWFALHAGQRMQSFNFFLVATAFLVAAYAAVIERHAVVAGGIAFVGAWICFWFNRMERRTKQLVKAGEAALGPFQRRLAGVPGIASLSILKAVDEKLPGSSSYSRVIDVIQWTAFGAFLSGAVYAIWRLRGPSAPAAIDVTPNTFWTAIQAIGTLAAFGAILWQAIKAQTQIRMMQAQTEVIRATTGYDLLLRLDDRFNSAAMRAKRAEAARTFVRIKHALASDNPPTELWDNVDGSRIEEILDLLELLALLVRKRALDPDDVWALFSHKIVNYYACCKETRYFDEWLDDPTFFAEFSELYKQMQAISKQRTGQEDSPDSSFLDVEASPPSG